MSFALSSSGRPVVYWVDDDYFFVDANLPALEAAGLDLVHYAGATKAFAGLHDAAKINRGLVIVDVMLAPGADEALFSANDAFSEEQMGLLLIERLAGHGLAPSAFPFLACSSRAYGGFRQRVEAFCQSRGVHFIGKSTDISSQDIATFARKIYDAFCWD